MSFPIKTRVNGYLVSTVMIHPILKCDGADYFETMVFRCNPNGKVTDWHDVYADRADTMLDAERRHYDAVAWAESQEPEVELSNV